ncbi:MAG: DUF6788 family protein [Gemmatimonadales bacterium]
MPDSHEVPARIRDLAAQLAQARPMRRGSLSQRYVKCSKPGCPCASDPEARHGPYFSLTRGVRGRTRSRFVSAAQAELVRRQVQAGHHFRRQVEAFWEACELWANAQLEGSAAASEGAQKRGSRQRWKPKLSKRSKHF